MKCPLCRMPIGYLSETVLSLGRNKACPYCGGAIKQSIAWGRLFLTLFIMLALLALAGLVFPSLAFARSAIAIDVVIVVAVNLSLKFEAA
jgi:hypothetical protein